MAVIAVSRRQAAPRLPAGIELDWIAPALAAAALVEFLVLRSGTRTAIHIPALESLSVPYAAVSLLGRYSYYVSAVLLALALPLLVVRGSRTGDVPGVALAASVSGFTIVAILARVGFGGLAADTVMVGCVLGGALAAAARVRIPTAAATTVFGVGFGLAAAFSLAQGAAARGLIGPFDGRWLLSLTEVAVVAFAVSTPWTLSAGRTRGSFLVAGFVGAVLFAAFLAEPATARFLLLWNTGLPGALPAVMYAAALGATAGAVSGLLGKGRYGEAAALLLLLTGGVGLHSTYQTGLVMAGIALLGLNASPGGRGRR